MAAGSSRLKRYGLPVGGVPASAARVVQYCVLCACVLIGVVVSAPSMAVVFEPREFASPADQARYKRINAELRCLVCQNQSIAESDAPLAQDLRREVFRMLNEGQSDEQITDFMVQRYGDFVLYRPPLNALTLALWGAPFALMFIGLVFLWRVMRRRQVEKAEHVPLSAAEQQRLRELVADNDSAANN